MCILTKSRRPRVRRNSSSSSRSSSSRSVPSLQTILETPSKEEQPRANKKTVAFFDTVMVYPVLHIKNYSGDEKRKTFTTHTDKKHIRADIENTLRGVRDGSYGGCTRGLEKFMDGGKNWDRRMAAIRDVLDEQEAQRREGVYDDSLFRKAYKSHARIARHAALTVGKLDELDAGCHSQPSPPGSNSNSSRRSRTTALKSSSKAMPTVSSVRHACERLNLTTIPSVL